MEPCLLRNLNSFKIFRALVIFATEWNSVFGLQFVIRSCSNHPNNQPDVERTEIGEHSCFRETIFFSGPDVFPGNLWTFFVNSRLACSIESAAKFSEKNVTVILTSKSVSLSKNSTSSLIKRYPKTSSDVFSQHTCEACG